jgi:hypothetical protein
VTVILVLKPNYCCYCCYYYYCYYHHHQYYYYVCGCSSVAVSLRAIINGRTQGMHDKWHNDSDIKSHGPGSTVASRAAPCSAAHGPFDYFEIRVSILKFELARISKWSNIPRAALHGAARKQIWFQSHMWCRIDAVQSRWLCWIYIYLVY